MGGGRLGNFVLQDTELRPLFWRRRFWAVVIGCWSPGRLGANWPYGGAVSRQNATYPWLLKKMVKCLSQLTNPSLHIFFARRCLRMIIPFAFILLVSFLFFMIVLRKFRRFPKFSRYVFQLRAVTSDNKQGAETTVNHTVEARRK